MESKKCLQNDTPERFQEQIFQELKELEEQQTKEALELLVSKHNLGELEKGEPSQDAAAMRAVRGRKRFCCGHRRFLLPISLANVGA